MQIAAETATCQSLHALYGVMLSELSTSAQESQASSYYAIRRNGVFVDFEPISITVTKKRSVPLRFDDGLAESAFSASVREPRAVGGRRDAELSYGVSVDSAAATVGWDGRIRSNTNLLCTRTCFRADLKMNSVRRGLP